MSPGRLALFVLIAACHGDDAPVCEGERLFGRPNANTGLGADMCGPTCTCRGEPFEAPAYGDAEADALLAWTLGEPFAELTSDPYDDPAPPAAPDGTVCAVVEDDGMRYGLETYPSEDEARTAGAIPTHFGACGVCSTLADLAVYMRFPDLTAPVRDCAMRSDDAEQMACLEGLGFTHPCAQIWFFNAHHTRDFCFLECIEALDQPYHHPDGTLNACLLCDEEQSGAVFKAVAGRTRRNTGIASAMCRPCSEVQPLLHEY